MSTNPTPTTKPTPAELADWLGRRAEVDTGFAHKLKPASACIRSQAAAIRELSEQLQNARNLGLEWCNDANGHIALCGDQLNAALSRTPDARKGGAA